MGNADTKSNNRPIADSSYPEIMTESELVEFLRIPEISNSKDYHNVVENLKRFRDLPRIHICNKALYPKKAIMEWINTEIIKIK